MKKKPSTASKKLSHGQQNTQPSRLTLTIFPPPKNQASTEKHVQLDLNNAEFQRTWIALESDEAERVRSTFKKILKLTWSELYKDKGKNTVNGIQWIPTIGFVVVIDDVRLDYSNLFIALDLARSMLTSTLKLLDQDIFQSLLGRISNDLSSILETERLLKDNHANLKKIATSIRKHALLVGFTQRILRDFISTGQVSNHELLKLYRGEGLKDEFAIISKDVEALFPTLVGTI